MKTAKDYSGAKTLYFKPELKLCPNCNKQLKRSHIAWRKHIFTLNSVYHVTSLAYKCSNSLCPQPQAVYHSQEAEMLSIKHYQFSLDVIAKVGHLRFKEHQTVRNIKQILKRRFKLQISRSEVDLLYQAYLALTTANRNQDTSFLQQIRNNGGIILAIDGVQPEKGNETLWILKDTQTGQTLLAKKLGISRPKQHRPAPERNQSTKHPREGSDKRWTKKHPTRNRPGIPQCSTSTLPLPLPAQHSQTYLRNGPSVESGFEEESQTHKVNREKSRS